MTNDARAETGGYTPYYDFLDVQPQIITTQDGTQVIYNHVPVKRRPDLEYWWLEIRDVRGGINKTYGDYDTDWDRASSSTLDTRFPRTLCLPQQLATATSPDPTGNLSGLHHSYLFDKSWYGVGAGNDVSLYTETSATDPTPTAITGAGTAGRPGAAILCLAPIVLGGATNAQALLIGRAGAVPILMTDASGTLSGTAIDSALTNCYGAIQTPLNDRTIVFYANNAFYTLKASDAIDTTPPTPVLTSQPNGGYALHPVPFRLGNGPERCYWGMPFENTANGVLLFGTEKLHLICSTNIEATDRQDLDFGLKGVLQARAIPAYGIIAAHDGERLVLHRGDAIEPIEWFQDREPDSDKEYRLRNMWVNGPELILEVNQRASASGTGNTKRWLEAYHLETGAIHQISAVTTLSTTGNLGVLSPYAIPSKNTLAATTYSDGSWRWQIQVPWGTNPYTLLRQTVGSQSGTGNPYESTGTWTGPYLELPGLEGLPKTVSKITFLGDVQSGGTAATAATVTAACEGLGGSATFVTGLSNVAQVAEYGPGVCAPFFLFKPSITATRTTNSARFTPNALPIRYEGFAWRDINAEAALIPGKEVFDGVPGK